MKKTMSRLSVLAILMAGVWFGVTVNIQAAVQAKLQYFVVTAAASPSNSFCQQNIMSFMDTGWQVGHINTDIASNPAALNMPCCLRPVDIMFSSGFTMWDGTNAPTGNFAQQFGKRGGWGYDWSDSNPFYATNIWFKVWSSDPANTPRYVGNVAFDTTYLTNLTFSTTLRGELWDTSGAVIARYYSGESVATHPVNRVFGLIRVGWKCNSMSEVALDLEYFRNHMTPTYTTTAAFYDLFGNGFTNSVGSQPCLTAVPGPVGTNAFVIVHGQRQLDASLTYGLKQCFALNNTNYPWMTIVPGGLQDGSAWPSTPASVTNSSQAYFRAFEKNGAYKSAPTSEKAGSAPALEGSNGPE